MKCPKNTEREMLSSFLHGGYCHECASFDERRFLDNWHPPFYLVFNFIRRFNYRDFRQLGDPVLAMIASEIWLYNIGRLLEREMPEGISRRLADEQTRLTILPKCNAHSLAQYFDLPYQTVRRKVNALIDKGMIARGENGELSVTAACEAAFMPEQNLETMREFVSTARCVLSMLDIATQP